MLRALTMFFMIFVNDVDGVEKIPEWIKHAKGSEDALGFADTIFPAFLFIVGLSIPIAINNRIKKGEPTWSIIFHITLRSLALLVMGFLHVNLENYNENAVLPRPVWEILITVGFFLVWLDYSHLRKKSTQYLLQGLGIALLVAMAMLFTGGSAAEPVGLKPYWWGILGLIGWTYLICSLAYLFSKGKLSVNFIILTFFMLFNVAAHCGWLQGLAGVREYIWIVGSGSLPAFAMAGVVASLLYTKSRKDQTNNIFIWLSLFALAMLAFGFLTRPIAGISKLQSTPAWVGLCTGISLLALIALIYLADKKEKGNWFDVIKPAGTSTLTCYLIPYLLYSIYNLFHFHYPTVFSEGVGGIIRSFAVAFFVVWITGLLEKIYVRLKI